MFDDCGEHRYKILATHLIKEPISPEKATALILEATALDADQFRMGKTKVLILRSSHNLVF